MAQARKLKLSVWILAMGLALAGCSSKPHRAPVEDRGTGLADKKALPGAENAGRPGYYTVQAGDTLIKIGLEAGRSWRDLAQWNNLSNSNLIEIGQVLRVVPPVTTTTASTGVVVQPVVSSTVNPVGSGANSNSSTPSVVAAADNMGFIWPATGSVIATFDESKNKGIDIDGKLGAPVLAAADGTVIYAGAGLRGYGNLIILQHKNDYLTAYAHNQTLAVKEEQKIRKGQKIAEMGRSDADRVKLHFEVRKKGNSVDPLRYLPKR